MCQSCPFIAAQARLNGRFGKICDFYLFLCDFCILNGVRYAKKITIKHVNDRANDKKIRSPVFLSKGENFALFLLGFSLLKTPVMRLFTGGKCPVSRIRHTGNVNSYNKVNNEKLFSFCSDLFFCDFMQTKVSLGSASVFSQHEWSWKTVHNPRLNPNKMNY